MSDETTAGKVARLKAMLTPEQIRILREVFGVKSVQVVKVADLDGELTGIDRVVG